MDATKHYILTDNGAFLLENDGADHTKHPVFSKVDKSGLLCSAFKEKDVTDEKRMVEFLLTLSEEDAKHIHWVIHNGCHPLYSVPIELAPYVSFDNRGGYRDEDEPYCELRAHEAITELTKKTLDDPTPEKLQLLREKIALYEKAKADEVSIPQLGLWSYEKYPDKYTSYKGGDRMGCSYD